MKRSLLTYLSQSCRTQADNTAVRFKEVTLSYRDLDRKSSQLGALLQKSGLSAGERVGIFLDKSPEAIVAIFSVLKAGSCYVPLDPSAPEQRLSRIISDCSLKWLITSSAKLPVVHSIVSRTKTLGHIVIVDANKQNSKTELTGIQVYFKDDAEDTSISVVEPIPPAPDDDLAYILYTSGSTGRPKGVMVSHRAACSFVDWAQTTFEIDSGDILSSHAPLHFDLSIFDIFVAIAAGATICLIPQGWSTFPKSIADFIAQNKITTWYSVPTALIQLVLHGGLEDRNFPELKRILFAGEVFPSKYLRRLMLMMPEVKYYNLYGPTETNVISYHQVKAPPAAGMDIPIGSLCDGVTGYVVSESGGLIPRGDIGELYVKGPTLMNGYWQDEHKTGEVLSENLFDPDEQGLVYKTGDMVHLDENGLLIYHGRCDTMIKSRGYRIELGEIETILSAHSKIKENAVNALPSEEFGSTISAVLVAELNTDLDEEEVRRFCSENLPVYMVPETIHFVSALPRTSTGKIDRTAVAELIP